MSKKRSQTAIEGALVQTQRFGFPIRQMAALKTPQNMNMVQTTRTNKELSIFQHFTISNAYNDKVEENFVPEQAPIDITQEE